MNDINILKLAESEGFKAAITSPDQVPVDAKFRSFCEENLCGKYGANYSCPPDCGTFEELHSNIMAEDKILVLQTIWNIESYENKQAIQYAKDAHNAMILRLKSEMDHHGLSGFCSGYNGCPLCEPCKCSTGEPCAHPNQRISCMSAYCVDVAELSKRCDLEFAWAEDKLYLFGMIAYHENTNKKTTKAG